MKQINLLVLAGGFGKRLRSAVSGVPKPLAPVNGLPYLGYQIESWLDQGVNLLTFLLHYEADSIEAFFIEHYWGYNRQVNGATMEYEVTHPKWRTRPAELTRFDLDVKALYGQDWAEVLGGAPDSIVLAEGSAVKVFSGARI